MANAVIDSAQWLGAAHVGIGSDFAGRLTELIGIAKAKPGLADASVRERYAQNGLEPVGGTAERFARQYRDDYDKFSRLIRELAIKLD